MGKLLFDDPLAMGGPIVAMTREDKSPKGRFNFIVWVAEHAIGATARVLKPHKVGGVS